MAEPEYAEEYSPSERWRLLAVLLCAGVALVLVSELYLFPWIKSFASTAHCRQVLGVPGTTALWFGVFVGVPASAAILAGVLLLPSAFKTIRTRCFPPPGTKVLRRTRIVTGWPAVLRGYAACATVLLLFGVAGWGYVQAGQMDRDFREPGHDIGMCSAAGLEAPLSSFRIATCPSPGTGAKSLQTPQPVRRRRTHV